MKAVAGHRYDIFISYAREDGLRHAERLERDLVSAGLTTWRDKRNLNPDQDYTVELEHAIDNSNRVLICVTPDIRREKSFVRREIAWAEAKKKPIVPLIFEDTLPPIDIINVTREDFTHTSWDQAFSALLQRLRRDKPAVDQSPSPPVDPFRSYLNTLYKQIVDLLRQTVFSEITLHSESAADAVDAAMLTALPLAFWDRAGTVPDVKSSKSARYNSFGEAFLQYEGRTLLLGAPGAGKTTTLLAFARDKVVERLNNSSLPLPILAHISTWDSNDKASLDDWLAGQVKMLKNDAISSLISTGKALLLLDGLDELGLERVDTRTRKLYDPRKRFLEALPEAGQMVVTCRIRDYTEIGKKAQLNGAVTLKALSDDQLRAYLAEIPILWQALEADIKLRDVVRTPLLLGILSHAYHESEADLERLQDLKAAPAKLREEIFWTYVNRRFEHEQRRGNARVPFSVNSLYDVLGRAAVEGMDHSKVLLYPGRGVSIDQSLRSFLNDDADLFIEQALRLHLLIRDRQGGLQFIHLLIRDHFGFPYALKCVKGLIPKGATSRYEHLYQSFELLTEIGEPEALDALLEHIHDIVQPPFVTSLCQFADPRVLLAYARTLSSTLQYSPDPQDRLSGEAVQGIRIVGKKLGVEACTAILTSAIGTASTKDRSDYVFAIGLLKLNGGYDSLVAATDDVDATVRGCAAWALGEIGDPRAVDVLVSLIHDERIVDRKEGSFTPWAQLNPRFRTAKDLPFAATVGQLAKRSIARIENRQK